MKKPVLLVLAAGLGSRYGGLKQLEPVGQNGELIIDYSIYDAKRAGFEEVIFVIRPEHQTAFDETIGQRIGGAMTVHYAYQQIQDLPSGFSLPEGREKPWGTGHAVWSARKLISGPFATINADDFYGATSFQKVYDFLANHPDQPQSYQYGLVGYALKNTVTAHGTVSRGICTVDEHKHLLKIDERTHIEQGTLCPRFSLDQGQTWEEVSGDAPVSMNLWGFTPSYMTEAEAGFITFLEQLADPLKGEYYLPSVADRLVKENRATVTVLESLEKWYGITYPEDRPTVIDAIETMTKQGVYPPRLWG